MSTEASNLARRLVPRPLRALIRRIWLQQFRLGFLPIDLAILSQVSAYSATGRCWNTRVSSGIGGWIAAPNHSHGYHGLLQQWWDAYGLGSSCLLVSESRQVAATFQTLYPNTKMVATDYYLGLGKNQAQTDVVWNLYEPIPPELGVTSFGSVVCQATFEHLMDPVGVMRKLATLLGDGSHLYLHTHTPLYPYHGWPKDYLRYFPDWFLDLGSVVPDLEVVEMYCARGHGFAAYRKRPVSAVQRS